MTISKILQKKIPGSLFSYFIWFSHKIIRVIRFNTKSPGREIVIISLHKLGDSIFTIPSILEIIKFFNRDVYIICFEETLPIFELFFNKKFIITFTHSDFYLKDRIAKSSIREKITEINPCKIIDLTGTITSASILIASGVREIIGINENYYKSIYTKYIPIRKEPHILDIYLDVVSAFKTINNRKLKEFDVKVYREGYILIHPFAGWRAKEWNFKKFINLAENLVQHYKVALVSPVDRINPDILAEIKSRGIEIIETTDVKELIEVIQGCSIIISNDSGPIYIGNILGKPTFTIYGPTNPRFHVPYGENHRFVQQMIKCSPSPGNKYCLTDAGRDGCPSFECMNLLKVDDVQKELESFIDELQIKKFIQNN